MNTDYQNIEFIERWLSGKLDPGEREAFMKWLNDHPEKRVYFDRYKLTYELLGKIEPAYSPDFDMVWKNIEASMKTASGPKKIYRYAWIAAAAMLLITAFLYLYVPWPGQEITISAGRGEHLTYYLPDSSKVVLNAASEVKYGKKYNVSTRELELRGEAFFKVRPGKQFVVVTPRSRTEVIGTSFNIKNREGQEMVICTSGVVTVAALDGKFQAQLTPGDIVYWQNGTFYTDSTGEAGKYLGWLDGRFIFEKEPVKEVITVMSRQFDLEIQVDAKYSDKLFTGIFRKGDEVEALSILATALGAEYRYTDNRSVQIY